ncbi:hypothetical protein M7784_07535 [Desulfovibrio aminophilus]|nr:RAMP superfamily CRISPR-associated protein [Desulfovibrio aminophilus]MCM0755099.1 hypothetical protein [Desulfovibrio aminophilus]
MELSESKIVLAVKAHMRLRTPLLLRSGAGDDIVDAELERSPDGQLHISGYVWASLLKRALMRFSHGKHFSLLIGDYRPQKSTVGDSDTFGLSPCWFEATNVNIPIYDVIHYNRINRESATVDEGALFNAEIAPAGIEIQMRFNWFLSECQVVDEIITSLSNAFWVIDSGVETIGGGWGYGYGRLSIESLETALIDLRTPQGRKSLWTHGTEPWTRIPLTKTAVDSPWSTFYLDFELLDGQLLCVSNKSLPLSESVIPSAMPDFFCNRQTFFSGDSAESRPVIPGKSFRQAVLSVPIERYLRTRGEKICSPGIAIGQKQCGCTRCRLFGNLQKRGMVSVGDAQAIPDSFHMEIIHRIQLCEHTQQNIQLFAGEYLSSGRFAFEIIVDSLTNKEHYDSALDIIETRIKELLVENSPPGWNRLGTTSTCTGQFQIIGYTKES